ncbi:MAG: sulfurtransferase [Chloroflexi bacterium]|nr:sulfurtransferase [Chloroflexota bacterium]MDA1002365.1 sulfurtransferase [Chloroflexota bacterium]
MSFVNPQYLVESDWLAAHLDDPDLRVLECTVYLRRPDPAAGLRAESARDDWAASHIPGSAYADLSRDLSDRSTELRFMLPPAEQFAEAMSRYGVGEGTRVVLYDRGMNMWAARIWWMLRAFGFDNAAVLNGGWKKWTGEGRPVSSEPPAYPAAQFIARPRAGLMADRAEVLAAIGDGATCIVNALSAEQHRGEGQSPYGRPGRIPSSTNVPAGGLVNPETHAYLPSETLRAHFADAGAAGDRRVITYCGGGIAASSDAFILTLLGSENVAVYDGSLSEWAADPALPLEVG